MSNGQKQTESTNTFTTQLIACSNSHQFPLKWQTHRSSWFTVTRGTDQSWLHKKNEMRFANFYSVHLGPSIYIKETNNLLKTPIESILSRIITWLNVAWNEHNFLWTENCINHKLSQREREQIEKLIYTLSILNSQKNK